MLSSVLVGLVSKYLGDFVELAPEQLSVGLRSGEPRCIFVSNLASDSAFFCSSGQVNVHSLRFKEEALRDLNLPITVKQGMLGRSHK
jgi:hypothetical protein